MVKNQISGRQFVPSEFLRFESMRKVQRSSTFRSVSRRSFLLLACWLSLLLGLLVARSRSPSGARCPARASAPSSGSALLSGLTASASPPPPPSPSMKSSQARGLSSRSSTSTSTSPSAPATASAAGFAPASRPAPAPALESAPGIHAEAMRPLLPHAQAVVLDHAARHDLVALVVVVDLRLLH
ncbi:hypothetical protein Mapa_002988 [Marchantia paleacea]|nr:hypothetical protein Mapa_002988 [Marchantia paleacea]